MEINKSRKCEVGFLRFTFLRSGRDIERSSLQWKCCQQSRRGDEGCWMLKTPLLLLGHTEMDHVCFEKQA